MYDKIMKANSSEHRTLNGGFIALMREKGGKNLSVVQQHSRTGLLLSRDHKKMGKAVVRTAEIHKILSLSLCVVSLGLIVLPSFLQKTIFFQRRKSYHYEIKYKCDAIGYLLSTVISLTDLIRGHVENTSHFKVVRDNGQIYLQMEMEV